MTECPGGFDKCAIWDRKNLKCGYALCVHWAGLPVLPTPEPKADASSAKVAAQPKACPRCGRFWHKKKPRRKAEELTPLEAYIKEQTNGL